MKFHPNSQELVTNGAKSVVFWQWDGSTQIKEYSPPPANRDFKHQLSNFTQSLFVADSSNMAISSTKDGNVVLWDEFNDGLKTAVKVIRYLN